MKQLYYFILAAVIGSLAAILLHPGFLFATVLIMQAFIGIVYMQEKLSQKRSDLYSTAWVVLYAITWFVIGREFFASMELAVINVAFFYTMSRKKRLPYSLILGVVLIAETFLLKTYPLFCVYNFLQMGVLIIGLWLPQHRRKRKTEKLPEEVITA